MNKRLPLAALSLLLAASPVLEVQARSLGIGRVLRTPFRAVRVIPGPVVLLPYHRLRRTLGIVVVASVGVAILSGLTRRQRVEVGRRTTRVLDGDPDKEVSDTYETKKGGKTVKITASPSLPPERWRDDPALKMADDPLAAQGGEKTKTAGTSDKEVGGPEIARGEGDLSETQMAIVENEKKKKRETVVESEKLEGVKLADVPPDAACRKVTTELKMPENTKASEPEKKETNTAILCKTADGKWQPAVF